MPQEKFFAKEKLQAIRKPTPFFAFNKEAFLNNVKRYRDSLPADTEICYAMKANSEPSVLKVANEAGIGFEVASKYELAYLKKIKVPAERILYGTSVKPKGHIRAFVKYGVTRFAFDSLDELKKIAKAAPGSKVYIRALVDDRSDSVFHMSEKFGAVLSKASGLLLEAKKLGLQPYGISFNVGSQARNPEAWARGIQDAAKIMNELLAEGIKIETINIGGGFPHAYNSSEHFPSIEEISRHINAAWKTLPYPVRLIVEPGRGLVVDAFVLVTSVIAKNKRGDKTWVYIDAGVYNALFEATLGQGTTRYRIEVLKQRPDSPEASFIITGPTGDNIDVINENAILPSALKTGDKLVICDTGAYTFALSTPFNGFPTPKIVLID